MQLTDGRTLGYYNIQKEATLHELAPVETMQIFVKPSYGQTLTLDVKASDTIGEVKAQIHGITGIHAAQSVLLFAGEQLEDARTVSGCNIRAGRNLAMRPAPSRRSRSRSRSRAITLDVQASDTFDNVTVKLYLRLPMGAEAIDVLELDVRVSDIIDNVKAMVQDEAGIPTGMQRLFIAGRQLEDCCTLSEYSIYETASIEVELATPMQDSLCREAAAKMQDFNAQDVTIPSEVFDSLRRAAAPRCRTFKACDITTTLEVFESLCQCSGSEGAGRSTRRPCPSRPRSLFRRAGQWQRFSSRTRPRTSR